MPERFQIGPNEPWDARTEDKKIAAARDAHRNWTALFDMLYSFHLRSIDRADHGQEVLPQHGALTAAGRSFVAAMVRLAEVENA